MSHKIGITACSNPMHPSFSADLARLCQILRELGFDPVLSPCLYDNGSGFSGTGAEELLQKAGFLARITPVGCVPEARELLRRGWYLGFDGPITYKNAVKALDVIAACPTDRMLLETDSPYLSPVPNRGKRNDSRNLPYIAARIAEIKSMTTEEVAEVTLQNGKQLFGL